MKEKIAKILSEYAIHCDTEKKAMELLRILHSYGYVWNNGHSLLAFSYWKQYKGNTYYTKNECPYKAGKYALLFGTIAVNPEKEIITFDKFKEQLNMEKEVKIQVPEGYEIDEENSTFKCIKFKPIKEAKTYDDVAIELFSGKGCYFIDGRGNVRHITEYDGLVNEPNNCVTEKQAEKLLAINKLMNVTHYLNKDWKPNWRDFYQYKSYLYIRDGNIKVDCTVAIQDNIVVFPDEKTAKKAIEILGEETIRKALGDY